MLSYSLTIKLRVGLAKQKPIDQLSKIEKAAIVLKGKEKPSITLDSARYSGGVSLF